ncbi:MAG: AsmA family protein, partial [Gammaproteobacteria bacterium]
HGLLTLDQFEALTQNGHVTTSGTLDVRGPTPTITVQHSTQGLQLNPLLVGILNKDVIAGLANITVQMSSQGNTLDTLIQGLSGNGQFSLENGALKGMNLTELAHSALKDWNTLLASFLPQDYQKRVPPAFQRDTEIQKLLTTLTIREGKLQANRIDAKLKGSALSGGGEINLSTFGYDSQLKLKLSESLTNPYIAQLEWPLQCSSNTKRLIPCKIDKHAVGRQIEKMAAKEAKRKAKATITKKVADKLGITESVNSPEDAAKAKLREEEKRAKQRLKEQLQEKFGGFH